MEGFQRWIAGHLAFDAMALVVAHRGASALHPPGNTLEAFLAAHELGADWVELDVHALGDGGLVVHHDPVLPDGRALHDMVTAELPNWVPLLDASIAACEHMGVNVEIKADGPLALREALIADTVGMLVNFNDPDRFLITSFDSGIIAAVRALAPTLRTGFLTAGDPLAGAMLDDVAGAGHVAVNPWHPVVTQETVDAAHARGLTVNVWTVDDPARISQLAAFGVDAIITNLPDICRQVLSGE
jgi:glycerophosphoryl diester phosphodiesterase